MRDAREALEEGLAEMGENLFYTLSKAQQITLLERSKQRGQVIDCESNYEYPGTLICDFCRRLDYETAEKAIQKVKRGQVPSEIVLEV